MSIDWQVGQVFSGGTISGGQTGQIAYTQTGSAAYTDGPPPFFQSVTITKDILASSQTFDGLTLQTVTITSVDTSGTYVFQSSDIPPGSVPAGFTFPFTAHGTLLGISAQTNLGTFSGTAGEFGESGTLALMGAIHLVVAGNTLDGGGAILSVGPQATGTVSEVYTPNFSAACYAEGTGIRTADGDVAIEQLRVGDQVISAFGGARPVEWLGYRSVDCRRHPRPADVWPVRVQAGAFGAGLPERDLDLSPDHAVAVDGALIPIRHLVNGATIRQVPCERITYWHLELPAHDVVLAEGLPAETYLDTGNRAAFANGGASVMAHADFSRGVWAAEACLELVTDGPVVDGVRARLRTRAGELGHVATDEADPVLLVGGVAVVPERNGDRLEFAVPPGAVQGVLVSRSFVPAQMQFGRADHRTLGLAVAGLARDGVALDLGGAFGAGWHAPEGGWRWTDGAASVALAGCRRLSLDRLALGGQYWRAA